jgi:hypothetical protein
MIVAFLMSLALGANPAEVPPDLVKPFTSVEECLVAADKANRQEGAPLHFCARVVFPV